VAFGGLVAIVVVKQMFGGIGKNFANPAITARVIMLIAFAGSMTTWIQPASDALISSATPLALIKMGAPQRLPALKDMFLGFRSGSLGETCSLAILLGGAYLLIRRVITWHIPVTFIGTVFVITALAGRQPVYQLMSGGLLLAAFFMATEYATSPSTVKGKIIFGIGCGLITSLIRIWATTGGRLLRGAAYEYLHASYK
jgi:electron transport complex protein RnfD